MRQVEHRPELFGNEAYASAASAEYDDFEAGLIFGGDDRSLIKEGAGTNEYHIKPRPVEGAHVFCGSCTGNPPTRRGNAAAQALFNQLDDLEGGRWARRLRICLSTNGPTSQGCWTS